jgi:predicted DNA-binding ribbon-helix-helix protein
MWLNFSARKGSVDIMQSSKNVISKRTVVIAGRKTGVSLEEEFWQCFRQIAAEKAMPISRLVRWVNDQRVGSNLSSAIRLFVLDYYRELAKQRPSNTGIGQNS